jgi:acyl carrier protein
MNIEGIRKLIQEDILNDLDLEIEADQDLLLSEILNSLNVILLITRLENMYGIDISPEDVTIENFGTLKRIYANVQHLRA